MFVGIGILVIPNAFVNGGLALTSVFLVLITLTFTHGMMQVVSSSPNIQFIKSKLSDTKMCTALEHWKFSSGNNNPFILLCIYSAQNLGQIWPGPSSKGIRRASRVFWASRSCIGKFKVSGYEKYWKVGKSSNQCASLSLIIWAIDRDMPMCVSPAGQKTPSVSS